jgi:hypothetical protein
MVLDVGLGGSRSLAQRRWDLRDEDNLVLINRWDWILVTLKS